MGRLMPDTVRVFRANALFPFEELSEASKDSHRLEIVFAWLQAGDVVELSEERAGPHFHRLVGEWTATDD